MTIELTLSAWKAESLPRASAGIPLHSASSSAGRMTLAREVLRWRQAGRHHPTGCNDSSTAALPSLPIHIADSNPWRGDFKTIAPSRKAPYQA
jgi:hypothetical protein